MTSTQTETERGQNQTETAERERTAAEEVFAGLSRNATWLAQQILGEELDQRLAQDDETAMSLLHALRLADSADDCVSLRRRLGEIREKLEALARDGDLFALPQIDEAAAALVDAISGWNADESLLALAADALKEMQTSRGGRGARVRGHVLEIREALGLDQPAETGEEATV